MESRKRPALTGSLRKRTRYLVMVKRMTAQMAARHGAMSQEAKTETTPPLMSSTPEPLATHFTATGLSVLLYSVQTDPYVLTIPGSDGGDAKSYDAADNRVRCATVLSGRPGQDWKPGS